MVCCWLVCYVGWLLVWGGVAVLVGLGWVCSDGMWWTGCRLVRFAIFYCWCLLLVLGCGLVGLVVVWWVCLGLGYNCGLLCLLIWIGYLGWFGWT